MLRKAFNARSTSSKQRLSSCYALDSRAKLATTAAVLVCVLLFAPAVYAADITLSDSCSLANAIRSANGDAQVAPANQCAAGESNETDVITFVANVEITEALPAITSDVRIVGNYILAAAESSNDYNIFTINSGDVRIENLRISGAGDSALKIAKTTDADLTVLFNVGSIGLSHADTHGGAMYIEGGADVAIHSSKISFNSAVNGNGGAIYVSNSSLTVRWSDIHDNRAGGRGGAIFFSNDSDREHKLTLAGNNIRRNKANDNDDSTETDEMGGAIYVTNAVQTDGAISTIESSSFTSHLARYGGAIYLADGKLNVDNTTIDENTASEQGGGIYAAGGVLTLRHATITGNQATNGGGLAVFTDDDEATTDPEVNVYNSIISGNTDTDSETSVCLADLLEGNEGNILEATNCTEAQSAAVALRIDLVSRPGVAMPRSVSTRYYRLLEGSPAIDNGVDTPGQMLSEDQTGHDRPVGDGYDSGSFEYSLSETWNALLGQPTNSSPTSAPSGPGEPTEIPSTCADVHESANGILITATTGLDSGVQCQEIDAGGIGIQSVIDAGFTHAVDVWGYVEQGVQVCFAGSGPLVFLDAATAPRTVMSIASFKIDGDTCTTIWSPGSLVLQSTQSANGSLPAATAQPLPLTSPTPVPQCIATTTAAVNLRDAPNGDRIGGIFPAATATVIDSSAGWRQVNYQGAVGWIVSTYATLSGECNFD